MTSRRRGVHRVVALVAALIVCTAFPTAASAAPPRGSLVIAGGALKADTREVWSRIVDLAGGRGARIAVFGTASEDPARSAGDAIAILNRYGARAYIVPVTAATTGADGRMASHDPHNVALVARARGVYFTGGDQGRITRALVDPSGRRSPVLDAVWTVFERGGVVAGSSAGAAIMSTTMFSEPRSTFELLVDGVRPGSDIAAGLGFVGDALFVDQHVLARGRFARMIPAMWTAGYRIGLGIDENTAAVVARDGRVTIAGRSGAVLIDLTDAHGDPRATPLQVSGVRIGLLRPGDRYDPDSRIVTPASNRSPLVAPDAADTTPSELGDVLGRDRLVDVMNVVARSPVIDIVATAVPPDAPTSKRTVMEFRFRRTPATRVFHDAAAPSSGDTIVDVELSISPR